MLSGPCTPQIDPDVVSLDLTTEHFFNANDFGQLAFKRAGSVSRAEDGIDDGNLNGPRVTPIYRCM